MPVKRPDPRMIVRFFFVSSFLSGCLQQVVNNLGHSLHDRFSIRLEDCFRGQGVLRLVEERRGRQQCLGGHAADVQTGAADIPGFDQANSCTAQDSANRGGFSAGTSADDGNVELKRFIIH